MQTKRPQISKVPPMTHTAPVSSGSCQNLYGILYLFATRHYAVYLLWLYRNRKNSPNAGTLGLKLPGFGEFTFASGFRTLKKPLRISLLQSGFHTSLSFIFPVPILFILLVSFISPLRNHHVYKAF